MRYFLTLGILFLAQSAYALDIVYPKSEIVTIQSPSTFFVGSSDVKSTLTINDEIVPVHPSGGFAKTVKLVCGLNKFVIKSDDKIKIYEINNPCPPSIAASSPVVELIEYKKHLAFVVAKEGAPLRSTPIDCGVNRIAHFQSQIPLNVDAEKNGFYRVILNSQKSAWIAKEDVQSVSFADQDVAQADLKFAQLLGRSVAETDEYYNFSIDFDKKIPYAIEGGYPFVVNFYGIKDYEDNTFSFNFPLTQKLAGYSGHFEGNTFVLKIRKFPEINMDKPLKNIKIVIDAGHGGSEFGAIGCLAHKEKDLNFLIAKDLKDELNERGAKVLMTREGDCDLGLAERVDIANKNDGMIFISIHGNALPDNADPNQNSGTSIYYYYPQAKPLADKIMNSMVTELGVNDDKVRQGSLAVVRNTSALSILVEVGYLINPADNAQIINKDFQKNTAKAIADGVEEYFKN